MDDDHSGHANVRMVLRSARVAIVFEGGDHWRYWARLAIYAASQMWGGAGFILVPHRGGKVHPYLLQAVRAYDPDHVLLLHATLRQVERAWPGVKTILLEGHPATGTTRQELIEQAGDTTFAPDPSGEAARQAVAEVCSPYRRRITASGEWHEEQTWLNADGSGARLTPVSGLHDLPGGSWLAAPEDWGGSLGVAVAARCGVMVEPLPGEPPQLGEEDRLDLIRWLLSDGERGMPPDSAVWHPAAAVSVHPSGLDTAFDRGLHGLSNVQRGLVRDAPVLLVAGDEAADFALAYAWKRLYGYGIWLASEWQPSLDVNTREMTAIRLELGDVGYRPSRSDNHIQLTTTSLGPERMSELARVLDSPLIGPVGPSEQQDTIVVGAPYFDPAGVRMLAIEGQYDQQFTAAVRRASGGVVMMTPPPAPAIEDPGLAQSAGLHWHVDLELQSSAMPRGRGLDGQSLFAPGENIHLTNVRSGRDGITYFASRLDFVAAGTAPLSRLARPRLRELGLVEWARLLVEQSGLSLELSFPGRRAETIRQRWDSRKEFVEMMTGPLLPVLRAFQPSHRESSKAYPGGEGVVLLSGTPEGYLTFDGMMKFVGEGISREVLRDGIDALSVREVVRRGLVLGCATCGRPSFVTVAKLGQANECPRCGAVNDLIRERWRQPLDEPKWYYDLHPVARELLADHGEVPLLLSRYLRSKASRYNDAPELELRDAWGKPVAEADLVAVSGDHVIVAEAKSNGKLGENFAETKRAAAKRVRLAELLRADQIVLATTEPEWGSSSTDAIRAAVTGCPWPAALQPAIRLVTSLGSHDLRDSRLDPSSGAIVDWN